MKLFIDYSELYLYEHSPKEHYKKHVLGEELVFPPDQKRRMLLGNIVGDYIENPQDDFVRRMKEGGFGNGLVLKVQKLYPRIERSGEHQVWLQYDFGEGVILRGKLDRFVREERIIDDYKTTENEWAWNQKKVDESRQLSVYDLLFYENFHDPLRELAIAEINLAKRGRFKRWLTSRGPTERKETKEWIFYLVNKMKREKIWELRKSYKEFELERANKLL